MSEKINILKVEPYPITSDLSADARQAAIANWRMKNQNNFESWLNGFRKNSSGIADKSTSQIQKNDDVSFSRNAFTQTVVQEKKPDLQTQIEALRKKLDVAVKARDKVLIKNDFLTATASQEMPKWKARANASAPAPKPEIRAQASKLAKKI